MLFRLGFLLAYYFRRFQRCQFGLQFPVHLLRFRLSLRDPENKYLNINHCYLFLQACILFLFCFSGPDHHMIG